MHLDVVVVAPHRKTKDLLEHPVIGLHRTLGASRNVDYLPLVGGTLLDVSWTGFAIMSSSWHTIDTDGGQCSESAWLEGLCATSIDVISMSASPGPPPPPGSGGISVP